MSEQSDDADKRARMVSHTRESCWCADCGYSWRDRKRMRRSQKRRERQGWKRIVKWTRS